MANAVIRADWLPVFTQQGSESTATAYALSSGGIARVLRVFNAEAVGLGATVDSMAPAVPAQGAGVAPFGIQIWDYRNVGLWVDCAGTSPNMKIQLLQSKDDVAADYAIPESGGTIITLTDGNPHVVSVTPTTMPWLRLRALANAGNSADATVTAVLALMSEA